MSNNEPIMSETEPVDEFEQKLLRSAAGRRANSRGKLSGSLLAKASGAERAAGYDNNLCTLDGEPVQFTSIGGGKTTFTTNPVRRACIVAAFSEGEPAGDQPVRSLLYGIRLEDCLRVGRSAKSKNAPGRLSVSLSQVRRLRLGDAFLLPKYTEAETVADRMDLMDAIDALTPAELTTVMDAKTKQRIKEFVLAGRKVAAPADAPVELQPIAESVTAESLAPAESAGDRDVDEGTKEGVA